MYRFNLYRIMKGIICCLQNQVKVVNDNLDIYQQEINFIRNALQSRGYCAVIVSASLSRSSKIEDSNKKKNLLPSIYHILWGPSEKIKKICSPYYSRMVFKSISTIQRHLSQTKPPLKENITKNFVYSIRCKKYKGKTIHHLMEEHQNL